MSWPIKLYDFKSASLYERIEISSLYADVIAEKHIGSTSYYLMKYYDLYYVELVGKVVGNHITFTRATPLKELKPRKLDFYAEAISLKQLSLI